MEKAWDQFARNPGSSPVSELSPLARKTWKGAKDRMLSREQQEALSPDHIKSEFEQWAARVVKIEWVGSLLRQDFRTRFAAAVLGTPHAEPTLYMHTVQALCQLAVHSLAEDSYGNVQRDVASIMRTLTSVIRKVEALKAGFPSHWTDPSGARESPEVDGLVECLRTGLDEMVRVFEPYSRDLRLSQTDVRLAKEAAMNPKAPAPAPAPAAKEAVGKARIAGERRKSEPRRAHQRVEMEQIR